jgi:hypothetical protein
MTWRDGDAVGTGDDPRLAKSVSTVYQEQHLAPRSPLWNPI